MHTVITPAERELQQSKGPSALAEVLSILTFYVTFQVVWPHDPYWSRPHLSGIIIM